MSSPPTNGVKPSVQKVQSLNGDVQSATDVNSNREPKPGDYESDHSPKNGGVINTERDHSPPSITLCVDDFRFSKSDECRTILSQMEIGVHERRQWMETSGVLMSRNGKKCDITINDIELFDSVSVDKSTSDDIVLTTCRLMNKTDFRSELKPMSDTGRYMKELVVLLDVQQSKLVNVVEKLLNEVNFTT